MRTNFSLTQTSTKTPLVKIYTKGAISFNVFSQLLTQSLFIIVFIMLLFVNTVKADVTIASGTTINAKTITGGTGILTINGTLFLNSNETLSGFTSVIINGPTGRIYWDNNSDITFTAGTAITINNPTASTSATAFGLQPTTGNGNASQRLIIGTTVISVSSDNANNAAFSFDQFNTLGGLPKFTITSNSPVCNGSALSFTITPDKTSTIPYTYTWSISPSSSTFTTNNQSSLTSSSTSISPTASDYTVTCSVKATGDDLSTKTINVKVTAPGTWLGANTNWNSTANWCNGTIPSSTTNVTISSGLSFYPTIAGTAGLVNNLTVASGATVTVTGTLKIAGSITSTNAITATAGTIELNGVAAQTISGNNFTSNTIGNLTINNTRASASATNPSVAINAAGGILNISGAVSFSGLNNAWFDTFDNLTLLSDINNTARIADLTNNNVNSGNSIVGKVIVERFIKAKRAWRLLSAPVTAASNVKISDSWQEGGRVTDIAVTNTITNPKPGYGTHVTFGKPALPGYDQGINSTTSIKYMTSTGWNGVPTATNNTLLSNSGIITDQQGYFLFVRGDRSTQLSQGVNAAVTNTTLRMKGEINTGVINIPLGAKYTVGTSNFRVIGNPYASPINFHKIALNAANVSGAFADAFYVWDPTIGSNAVGGWVALSYNASSGLYDRTVITGATSTINNNGDVQSGSAFMINYNGSATTLQIKESNKAIGSNTSLFRPLGTASQIRTTLLEKLADKTLFVNDATLVTFNEAYNNLSDEQDLNKMYNFSESISTIATGNPLAIERRLPVAANDTILFELTQLKQKDYQLELVASGLNEPAGTAAFLEDAFLKTSTPISLTDTNRIDFSVSATVESAKADRFKVVFRPSVNFLSAIASESESDGLIDWKLSNEFNINRFEIERSLDGISFEKIGIALSKGESKEAVTYTWTDKDLQAGNYTYRIKSISNNNVIVYSKNMQLKINSRKSGIYIYPNPVKGNTIAIQMNNVAAGEYQVLLTNATGGLILKQTINYSDDTRTILIKNNQNFVGGFYLLQLISSNKKATTLKMMAIN